MVIRGKCESQQTITVYLEASRDDPCALVNHGSVQSHSPYRYVAFRGDLGMSTLQSQTNRRWIRVWCDVEVELVATEDEVNAWVEVIIADGPKLRNAGTPVLRIASGEVGADTGQRTSSLDPCVPSAMFKANLDGRRARRSEHGFRRRKIHGVIGRPGKVKKARIGLTSVRLKGERQRSVQENHGKQVQKSHNKT